VHSAGGLLEIGFSEILDPVGWMQAGHRRGLKNLVVQRHGQFFVAQAGANQKAEFRAHDPR
jgi:hypothetical protein